MSAPLDAKVNLVEDALMLEVLRIGSEGGASAWLTQPATVKAAPLLAAAQADLPAIYLQASEWSDKMGGAGMHEARVEFWAWLITSNVDEPHRELQRLARDVIRALVTGERRLEAVADLGLEILGYTYQPEVTERIGAASGILRFALAFHWSHENP